jgi:hypothetical protein
MHFQENIHNGLQERTYRQKTSHQQHLKKLAVQWLIEHYTTYQIMW